MPIRSWLTALVLVLPCACTGPSLHVDNESGHKVFVDGFETWQEEIPFRYYGTTRWDALPAPRENGDPDFDRLPTSVSVVVPPPASHWLFPLDFGIELVDRMLHGRRDQTLHIEVQDAPEELRGDFEIQPAALGRLSARARAARIQR